MCEGEPAPGSCAADFEVSICVNSSRKLRRPGWGRCSAHSCVLQGTLYVLDVRTPGRNSDNEPASDGMRSWAVVNLMVSVTLASSALTPGSVFMSAAAVSRTHVGMGELA